MPSRGLKVYLGGLALLLLVAVAFALRPTPIISFDGDDLSASVNGGPLGLTYPCDREGSEWTCSVVYDGGSGATDYTVDDPDTWGCWTAELAEPGSAGIRDDLDDELEGCISILDHF